MKLKVKEKLAGFIFILFGYLIIRLLVDFDEIIIAIIFLLISYMILYIGTHLILYEFLRKNDIVEFIFYRILVFPIRVLLIYHSFSSFILSLFLFVFIYLMPSLLFLKLNEFYPVIEQYSLGIVYILSLISIFFFAYKSSFVMNRLIAFTKANFLVEFLNYISDESFTRKLTYLFMVIIYILYNILTLSGLTLSLLPNEILVVIKEVFLTFIAVDSLREVVRKNKDED